MILNYDWLVLMVFEQGGIFVMPQLPWQRTSGFAVSSHQTTSFSRLVWHTKGTEDQLYHGSQSSFSYTLLYMYWIRTLYNNCIGIPLNDTRLLHLGKNSYTNTLRIYYNHNHNGWYTHVHNSHTQCLQMNILITEIRKKGHIFTTHIKWYFTINCKIVIAREGQCSSIT